MAFFSIILLFSVLIQAINAAVKQNGTYLIPSLLFLLLISCSDEIEWIDYPTSKDLISSSSSEEISSSSEEVSSSSEESSSSFEVSSSSIEEVSSSSEISSSSNISSSSSPLEISSSSVVLSSSSEVSSSSENAVSSSSEALSSSSNILSSSSSLELSSSSSEVSSSSSGVSSSSSVVSDGCEDYQFGSDSNRFCFNGELYFKCKGEKYNPESQICVDEDYLVIARCGGTQYNPLTQNCCVNTIFERSNQKCDTDNVVKTMCGTEWYDASTHFCSKGNTPKIVERCGGKGYNATTHFCYKENGEDSGKVGLYCGTRTDKYNPDLYMCKSGINSNGIYLKTKPKDAAGKEYEAVLIGTQTWMAENLNYNASGSKCYGEVGMAAVTLAECYDERGNVNVDLDKCYGTVFTWPENLGEYLYRELTPTEIEANCNKYGRLYDQNIAHSACPDNWHLPSYEEWNILMNHGLTHLKAVEGWTVNGTDDYGFAATPTGGSFFSGDYILFSNIDWFGMLWSSSYDATRPTEGMSLIIDNQFYWDTRNSMVLRSVRCVMD